MTREASSHGPRPRERSLDRTDGGLGKGVALHVTAQLAGVLVELTAGGQKKHRAGRR